MAFDGNDGAYYNSENSTTFSKAWAFYITCWPHDVSNVSICKFLFVGMWEAVEGHMTKCIKLS